MAYLLGYNGRMRYFDRDFFKFLLTFIGIILVSIGIIAHVKGFI